MPTKYRSKFEGRVAKALKSLKKKFKYEARVLRYTIPSRVARYTPDFELKAVTLEVKGYLDAADRKKMLLVREQHPDERIVFIFQKPHQICSGLKELTHAQWAEKNGYEWLAFEDLKKL